MLEPWNHALLLPPPVHTSPCGSNIDAAGLTYTCNTIVKVLSRQSPLHKESALFSRLVYKFDKKFRNDIGYRNFKKVNTALRKYLLLNLLKDVENFKSVLPDDDNEFYLPTRQMLQYVMIRIITFSKIMLRICVCSKQASIFYLNRIKRGESHWMSLMPYAVLSRIWTMTKVLLQHACSWYANFHPFLEKLALKGMEFLPCDFTLPKDLEKWLDLGNIDDFGRFEWSSKKQQLEIDPGLLEDEEGDRFESILEYVKQINSEESPEEKLDVKPFPDKLKESEQIQLSTVKNVDQGEVISRDIFRSLSKSITGSATRINHYMERVTNKESLHQFITTEDKLRTEESSQSLSTHLSFMQWQALKKSLLTLYESLANNRKIERKFQKIWKDKCLDYL